MRFSTDVAAACWTALLVLGAYGTAGAHGIVGRRMFIEPLTTEDANVKNELGLPNADFLRMPDGTTREIGISLEKQLYPGRLSIVGEIGRIARREPAATGWDDFELGLKWQAWTNRVHEFALSPAVFAELPTGSTDVSERETSLRPMLLVAKGFGDVATKWLRPLAVQADLGYEQAANGSSRRFMYDGVLMYSLPYLNHWVRHADRHYDVEDGLRRGLSIGSTWGNLFPFIEFNARRGIGGQDDEAESRLRVGACWMGKYVQLSLAADMNLPADAGARRHGVIVLADWFLDEFLPAFGRPLIGAAHGDRLPH